MANRKTTRSEERKDEKRKLILRSAAKVFTQKGYHQTAVKDIVEDAGVSVGTFYLYFTSKENIFETLFDMMERIHTSIYEKVFEQEGFTVVQRFCRVTTASLWTFEHYRELTRIMLVEAVGLNPNLEKKRIAVKNQSYLRMKNVLDMLENKKIINIPDSEVGALVIEGASLNISTSWLLNEIEEPLRDFSYSMNVFMLQALGLSFEPNEVKKAIKNILTDMDKNSKKYISESL